MKKLAASLWFCMVCALLIVPMAARAEDTTSAIKQVLVRSTEDWNRGDLDAFATCYKNSPDILFIGKKTAHGYAQMLATYKTIYDTPAKRGTLTFTDLEVQPLDAQFATATGWFHLKRTAEGSGDAQGYFLLVLERTPDGWRIVRDDSTNVPMTWTKP